ncbi:hypothetical protein HY251_00355 [bacterium]|nr:hypothetical protein [bacterium]
MQEKTTGPARLELSSLCCEALGRIGTRKGAIVPLARFLASVEDERRAVPAGVALCILGGEEAMKLLSSSRERFGTSGPFWEQVSGVLERRASARLASETPRACLDRALLRRERGDLAGAIADATRALEIDPQCGDAFRDRAIAREMQGDRAGAISDLGHVIELSPPDTPQAASARALLAELQGKK